MPTPTSDPAADLPRPPASFDPARIGWTGDARFGTHDYTEEFWTAAIDGSRVRRIAAARAYGAMLLSGGEVVLGAGDAAGRERVDLYVRYENGRTRRLVGHVTGEVAQADDGTLYVSRLRDRGPFTVDDGLWRVRVRGSRPSQVLPPLNPRASSASDVIVRHGGAVVVRGFCGLQSEGTPALQVLHGGRRWHVQGSLGRALGFDPDGHVIARGCRFGPAFRYDLDTRRKERLPQLGQWLHLTDGGRYLVADSGGVLNALDLRRGARQQWRLNGSSWAFTDLGGSRYVVLEGFADFSGGPFFPGWLAIVDLRDGWLGYLPPIRIDLLTTRQPRLPPPPKSFDPTSIVWTTFPRDETEWGLERDRPDAVWTAYLDGSELSRVAIESAERDYDALVPLTLDELVGLDSDEVMSGSGDLVVIRRGAEPRLLIRQAMSGFAVATREGAVYVSVQLDASPQPVLQVPLDGTPPRVVSEDPSDDYAYRTAIAATPDGRLVASSQCDVRRPRMELIVARRPHGLGPSGLPLGFDGHGRLIYQRSCAPGPAAATHRFDTFTAEVHQLWELTGQQRVTSDGALLIDASPRSGDGTTRISVMTLEDGSVRRWRLDGAWDLTSLGGDRYAVLIGLHPAHRWHAVVDLEAGWIGYLPPIEIPDE